MSLNSTSYPEEEIYYGLALALIPGIGHIYAKTLLSYNGSFRQIFHSKGSQLLKTPGMGKELIRRILNFTDFDKVEEELKYIQDHQISPLFYNHPDFPQRLLYFNDSPFLIFRKGNAGLNSTRTLGIVGTRSPSQAGVRWVNDLISDLKDSGIAIISGFAYGIDITAHRASIREGLETVGVLAGGLENIYPALHRKYIDDICRHGSIITESFSHVLPDKQRFPMRNRIIAALSDGLIVVESGAKGGSIITAEFAFSYNKNLMAVPGKPCDLMSKGCNILIKTQKASMVEDSSDVLREMDWHLGNQSDKYAIQTEMFNSLSDKEQSLITFLIEKGEVSVDEIIKNLDIRNSELASMILSLTLDGLIVQLPGSRLAIG
ncbi:MAG TPA: DNA-processing protein DprA [Saprospiraceae bacterium]|nr:MAG: DNA protecting protein DprA [Candidatus Parvibacillus calidus]MCC7149895.1 DNA-protecting protein DprA [Saprospiraceae bacterium]WKZ62321.1 MAG: DNA-processing protein DprA [Saprospiraceae bacterium]HRN33129.1 DNA-processing protein DprA [Saprospiraceae bacterium]HRP83803.1 DNA-processing protein DprA [Saprospiraceae bacterium]